VLLIPSIDLRGGACVRLYQGDFDAETRYATDPLRLLTRYRALGASWLHIVDLDGARDGTLGNRALIGELAAKRAMQLQVGGGVRDAGIIDELLSCGIERVVIGSAAVERPAEVADWLHCYGPERLCLAFDVRLDAAGVPRLQTRGWREASAQSLWDAIERFAPAGLRHVLCTDIERDGALQGPNVALYTEAQRRHPDIQWQASAASRAARTSPRWRPPASRPRSAARRCSRNAFRSRSCGYSCQTHNPCLDVRDGQVVKGVRFRDHRIVGDILELAMRYRDEGADELCLRHHGEPQGRSVDREWVARVARVLEYPSASPAASARSKTPRWC